MAVVPRWEVPLRVRVGWNVVVAVYTAFVAVLIGLDRGLSESRDWAHNDTLIVTTTCVLIALSLVEAVRRATARLRASGVEKTAIEVRNQLAIALVSIAEQHGLSVSDFGAGLFLIKPRGLKRPESLVRPHRVRIPDDLHESPVRFTKGKGAVGRSWADQTIAHTDWIHINRRYSGDTDLVRHRWDKMSDDVRRNFEQGEFISLLGKYAEVLAAPVMIDGKLVGVVALDRRWDSDDPHQAVILNNSATKKVLGGAAKILAATLKQ